MPNKNKRIIIFVVILVVVAGAALLGGATLLSSPSSGTAGVDDASSTVAAFGAQLQKVSLLAPDVSSTIASTYASYVTPQLLSAWEATPQSAPGRRTSSPWPDHIRIDSIGPQGTGYIVNGDIIEMTSDNIEHGGNSGTIPVIIQLIQQNGSLLIAAYQQQSSS
jgi:hypothetical protein